MKCANCGNEIYADQLECPYCGNINSALTNTDTKESGIDKNGFDFEKLLSLCNIVKDTAITIAEMKMEIAKVEAQVDMFCASLETDLKKYQQRLPIVEKQLNNASERIDRFVDKILEMDGDNTSPEYLQRQSLLLDALTSINNQFNSILIKLL
jgi:hypothetical protein